MLLMQLKGVNNEQILCTVQYTMLFSKYIVLETLACLITFIYSGCVETISGGWGSAPGFGVSVRVLPLRLVGGRGGKGARG